MDPKEIVSNKNCFYEKVNTIRPYLLKFCKARIFNHNDALDITQNTVLILCSKKESYKKSADFWAWAFTILRFQIMRFLTYSKRNREDNTDFTEYYSHEISDKKTDDPFDQLSQKENSFRMQELINFVHKEKMSPKEKCFFSFELAGYSKCKIMSLMSIKPVSYYAYRKRCRSRIKNYISSNNIKLDAQ